jgi:hypothetical protein
LRAERTFESFSAGSVEVERGWLLDCDRGGVAGFFAEDDSAFFDSPLTTGAVSFVDFAPSSDFSDGGSFFVSCDAETVLVAVAGVGSEIVVAVSTVVIPVVLAALELRFTET